MACLILLLVAPVDYVVPGDTVKIMPKVVYCVPINIAHVRQQNVTLKTLFLNRQNHSLIKVKAW